MDKNSNSLNWFEIPAVEMKRAKKFYEKIFDMKMEPMQEMMGMEMISFPWEAGSGKANGALVKSKMHKPSKSSGAVIYLNADPEIEKVVKRIEKAGGKIVMPKTEIGPGIGFMAFFIDTEGNKMGLHAQK